MSLDGVERLLLEAPGTLEIHDVAPDGRALVASLKGRGQMFGGEKGAPRERNLAWLETSTVIDISDDGLRLLFKEESEREGGKIGIYMRDLNGAAAIRLGDGSPQDLSGDGRWALALRFTNRETQPQVVSPDGRLVACAETAGGIAIVLSAEETRSGCRGWA